LATPQDGRIVTGPSEEVSMPEEINGLPLHPLIVHAVVVLVPLMALVAVLFLVPRFRRSLRWPMVLLAVAAVGSTFLARESGGNLEESLQASGPLEEVIERHEELATQLWYIVIAFAIVACIAAYVLRPVDEVGPFPGEDAEGDEEPTTTLDTIVRVVVAVLVVVGAVAAGVQTYRTGEQGSQAVWDTPDDCCDYSSLGALE
jgi:flagellar basal body-associated protein FliL